MPDLTRPTFDDRNETITNPLSAGAGAGAGGTGTPAHDAQCALPPAGWVCTRGRGHDGPCAAVPVEGVDGDSSVPAGMTQEELHQGAAVLFDATKRRIVILLQTLVRLAESGDFALWAPLGAMDEVLRGLDWTSVPPLAVAKFYKLIAMTLTTYGTRLDTHAMAVLESVRAGHGLPDVPVWTGEDTTQMYDMVEQIFAPPAEATETATEAEGDAV